jgi:Protein of unknown function (DUF4058)
MRSPFPGMNPYLEHPDLWAEFHNRLIVAIADDLAPSLRPQYRVAIEKRVYETWDSESLLVGIPDVSIYRTQSDALPEQSVSVLEPATQPVSVLLPIPEEVREGYLEIRDVKTGEIVTAIELLSPKNKRYGEGRQAYETKRRRILGSQTHLIEIDLLRQGEPMPVLGKEAIKRYRILLSRSSERPHAELYTFDLIDVIPTFALPLKQGSLEPTIDLQTLLHGVYDRASFDLAIDYNQNPNPPLTNLEKTWLDDWLINQGLREPHLIS